MILRRRRRISGAETDFLHEFLESIFGSMRLLVGRLLPRFATKADFLPIIVFLFPAKERDGEASQTQFQHAGSRLDVIAADVT